MTKKAALSFKNTIVFDKKFKPDIETCSCVVSKMFFAGKMNVDGTINKDNITSTRKSDLWSYIYYLFYYNNSSIPEFMQMKAKSIGGDIKANAKAFYNVVSSIVDKKNAAIKLAAPTQIYTPFDIQTLGYFIEVMIYKYNGQDVNTPKLMNPVIDFVKDLIHKSQMVVEDRMSQIVVKTGNNNVKIVSGSDPSVSDADIKVNIKPVQGGAKKKAITKPRSKTYKNL